MYYVEPINSDSIELQNALTEHEVIEKARKSKALEKHLEVKIDDEIYDILLSKI